MRWLRKLFGLCLHEDELVQLIDHYAPGGVRMDSCTHIVRCSKCGRVASKTINFK